MLIRNNFTPSVEIESFWLLGQKMALQVTQAVTLEKMSWFISSTSMQLQKTYFPHSFTASPTASSQQVRILVSECIITLVVPTSLCTAK
jgi:hypothetical protein